MPEHLFENEFIRQGISFENAFAPVLACSSENAMQRSEIVVLLLKKSGLTQSAFASKIGVSQGTISKWINEGHQPNTRQWDNVVSFAERTAKLRGLIGGSENNEVAVMGFIGAGAEIDPEFEQVPQDGLEQIQLPFDVPPQIIAFRVRGDSMLPTYRDGDAVLVLNDTTRDPADYVGSGEEVAVRTAEGKRYLKEIEPGSKRGFYNLRSHNASLIKNVKLAWVGEVHSIVRGSQLRRVSSKQGKAETRISR